MSEDVLKDIMGGGQFNPLNYAEKEFVMANYKEHSAPAMAKKLHRDTQKIYEFLEQQGLQGLNRNRFGRKRPFNVPGMFNCDERECWLTGK